MKHADSVVSLSGKIAVRAAPIKGRNFDVRLERQNPQIGKRYVHVDYDVPIFFLSDIKIEIPVVYKSEILILSIGHLPYLVVLE